MDRHPPKWKCKRCRETETSNLGKVCTICLRAGNVTVAERPYKQSESNPREIANTRSIDLSLETLNEIAPRASKRAMLVRSKYIPRVHKVSVIDLRHYEKPILEYDNGTQEEDPLL